MDLVAQIIKSISLDPQTAELSSRIPNFSKFVRECLIRHHLSEGNEWIQCKREGDDGKLCLPMVEPRCMKCWPSGPPPQDAWLNYCRKPQTHDAYGKELGKYVQVHNPDFMDHDLVREIAEEANPKTFSFDDLDMTGNAKPKKKKAARRSIISRMLNFLRL